MLSALFDNFFSFVRLDDILLHFVVLQSVQQPDIIESNQAVRISQMTLWVVAHVTSPKFTCQNQIPFLRHERPHSVVCGVHLQDHLSSFSLGINAVVCTAYP